MALIERIVKTDPDESRHIPYHTFHAALIEIAAGNATLNQLKSYWNATTEDSNELDAIAALAPVDNAQRALFLERMHAVFALAEAGVPGYDTPAGVRTKLGI